MNDLIWKTEKRKLKDLAFTEYNQRKMTDKQNKDLKESLDKFSLVEIPVINTDSRILAGHMRIRLLKEKYGDDYEIDVRIPNRELSKEEADEYLIRSNKNVGDWDFDVLHNEFDLDDLKDWGFEDFELDIDDADIIPTIGDDEVPEVREDAITVKGDLYELGNHRLLCGDALEIDNLEKLMQEETADMIITDPPYNVDYVGKTKDALKIQNDKMSDDNFYQFLLTAFTNAYTVCGDGCPLYVFHSDTEGLNFRKAFIDSGFKLAQCCIWVKQSMVMGRQDYQWQHEPILYGWKPTASHKWFGKRNKTTIWNCDKPAKSTEHPTMKPIELIQTAISNSTKKNMIVCDMFGGSGSTLIACEKIKRNSRLVELDERYCDVIVRRYIRFCNDNGMKPVIKRNGVLVDTKEFINSGVMV